MRRGKFMKASTRTAVMAVLVLLPCVQAESFDVVSVRRAATKGYIPPVVNPLFFRIVCNLADAVEWAYKIQPYQIAAGPSWLRADYYQIEIRTGAPASRNEMRAVLQRVLADRFKLRMHSEGRQRPIFALTVVNAGQRPEVSSAPCGEDGCINVAPGRFVAVNATMDAIAATLSNMVDRPVLNETGLAGRYNLRVNFDPASVKRFDGQTTLGTQTDDPSIFAALQDFGLKLEPKRAAVQTFVIDSAAKPSPN
jgi:uncharacterized protein (TIGR03435 family)